MRLAHWQASDGILGMRRRLVDLKTSRLNRTQRDMLKRQSSGSAEQSTWCIASIAVVQS